MDPGSGQPSLCFVTPTCRRDLASFDLLRRTVRRFAPDIPHRVIVDQEELGFFRNHCRGRDAGLVLVGSREILPAALERGRSWAGRPMLRHLLNRFGPDLLFCRGWHAQQLMKIFALAALDREVAVFLDSDLALCREVRQDFFFHRGRPRLFVGPADDAEKMDFDLSTHLVLGRPLDEVEGLHDYIFSPAVFRRSTAARLLEALSREGPRSWIRRFLGLRRPSEYNLLGYAARELEHYAGYHVEACRPSDLHHAVRYPEDLPELDRTLERLGAPGDGRKFFLLQSNLPMDPTLRAQVLVRVAARLLGAEAGPARP